MSAIVRTARNSAIVVAALLGLSSTASAGVMPIGTPMPAATTKPAWAQWFDREAPRAALVAPTGPLEQLVVKYAGVQAPDAEADCLATAVYFEARGEPTRGQLAVAAVVLNRAASGKYPTSLCGVVTQTAQFSFVRRGKFPRIDRDSYAWRSAVAVAHIARERLAETVAPNVLWYHARYVSPSWGRRLTRVAEIGAHIFYS